MKLSTKIAAISIFVFLHWTVSIAGMNYAQTELVSFAWGDSVNQMYYYYDSTEMIMPSATTRIYLDNNENIYMPYDREDFRKFDKSGKLLYQLPIYVVRSAASDDGYLYYEYLGGLDTIRIIDSVGNKLSQQYIFSDYGASCTAIGIINRGPKVLFCGMNCAFELASDRVSQINYQFPDPKDSHGYYYLSVLEAMKGNYRLQEPCYQKQFLDIERFILKPEFGRAIASRDTIRVENIGTHPLEGAEVLGVDNNDNIFIWLFYGFNDFPMEMVVLSDDLVEQYRFVFKSYDDSKQLIWRPQVNEDGTVYEFRVEQDGVHIVKWTRE